MNNNKLLEFDTIQELLAAYALSPAAKEKCRKLSPYTSLQACKNRLKETTEAKKILECFGSPPLPIMAELKEILEICRKDALLSVEQLTAVSQFLSSCKRMKAYLTKAELLGTGISQYGKILDELPALLEELECSIRYGEIDDFASTELKNLRRKIESCHIQIKQKLESILRNKKDWFSDAYVSERNGRFVLPVKKDYKQQLKGTVIGVSGTGETYFMEPDSIQKLQKEEMDLQIEEENEVRKILYTLTSLVDDCIPSLQANIEVLETLDFAFAKAKLSCEMSCSEPMITEIREIRIINGRHPLLKKESCVPLDFEIGGSISGVVITGPNTGGKTVALKTIGLLSLMAQSGLHVPAESQSVFSIHRNILCDIGDGQSITENLSTFSAHLSNIISILEKSGSESLILLDELGSGTDPAEGMGIAVAILHALRKKRCLFIATTHYPEVKEYAKNTPNILNARMTFDRETLKPLYCLELGEAGASCALFIAKRLGFPEELLKIAQTAAYSEKTFPEEKEILFEKRKSQTIKTSKRQDSFQIGDSVIVYPQKKIGIVYQKSNEKGEIGVQIKKEKNLISHKRLKLHIPAKELYPENYDFSILFDTVESRKIRHQMERKYSPDRKIESDD